MPAARPHEEHRGVVLQCVMPPALRIVEGDRAPYRVVEIALAIDQVVPARGCGVLEIGHEYVGAAIQRVDDHLAVGRPGDLDTSVAKIWRDRCGLPVGVADGLRLGQEIGFPAGIEPLLQFIPAGQEPPPFPAELALELDREGDRFRCQHLLGAGNPGTAQDDAVCDSLHAVHRAPPSLGREGAINRVPIVQCPVMVVHEPVVVAMSGNAIRAVRVELHRFGAAGERRRRGMSSRDRHRHRIEIPDADLALVSGGGVTSCLGEKLGLLQLAIGRHAAIAVATRQLKHR